MTTQHRNSHPRRRIAFGLGAGALAAALGLASVADARPPGGPGGPHMGPPAGLFGPGALHMVERLDLTEEQELAMVRLKRALRAQHEAGREAGMSSMKAIAEQVASGAPDRAQIHELLTAEETRRAKEMHASVDLVLDFYAKLTAEQKSEITKIIERQQEHFERMKERFGEP